MDWFHFEIQSGEPIIFGPHRITLRSLIAWLRIPLPHARQMFYLNRPIAVETQTGSEPPRREIVFNFTRLAVIGIYLLALISSLVIWRFNHVRK